MGEKTKELDSISAKTFSCISFLSSDPLFSSIITLYTLILLYFPHIFLRVVFSPVLISTGILLLTLLRLGASQKAETGNNVEEEEPQQSELINEDRIRVESKTEIEPESRLGFNPNPIFIDSFLEWNVRAPLDVIYEAYEGEEGVDYDDDPNEKQDIPFVGSDRLERCTSLSMYYPESDTETSSDGDFPASGDWDSPENMCFRWDEEDREGLIEIALDGKRNSDFHADEDNMIEIDISPARIGECTGEMSDSVNLD